MYKLPFFMVQTCPKPDFPCFKTPRFQAVREVIPAPAPCWQPWTLWRQISPADLGISWGFHGNFMGISTWETTGVANLIIANTLPLKTAIEFVSFPSKKGDVN